MTATTLTQISEHVYWLSPGPPDRPSLAAVVGTEHVLLLDAGASDAHARLFLEALIAAGLGEPTLLALSHRHWDHVFGAAELGLPTIAHRETAAELATLAGYSWTDGAIEERVAAGIEIQSSLDDIKIELPTPRNIRIHQPEIIVDDRLELRLGGVTCEVAHVGGDHSDDATVFHIPEDRVLFLGDCVYPNIHAPVRHYTPDKLLALHDRLDAFDARLFIGGHMDEVLDRTLFDTMAGQARLAVELLQRHGPDQSRMLMAARAQSAVLVDEELEYYVDMVVAGAEHAPRSAS